MSEKPDPDPGGFRPASTEELCRVIKEQPMVLPIGGGTKWTCSEGGARPRPLSMAGLTGIIEYQPDEYTMTARAGTPLTEIKDELGRHGQCLPFDPPFASAGASLGGTVASGLSGSGSQRHGRLRDFILAIEYVTGEAVVGRAGARVVKNSAGFDLPKLMVGSLGRFGVLTEITFKVFPDAAASRRLTVPTRSREDAVELIVRLNRSPLVLDALDLGPDGELQVALAGQAEALEERCLRLAACINREVGPAPPQSLTSRLGTDLFATSGNPLAKIALSPARIPALDHDLRENGSRTFYTFGGATGWVSWPEPVEELHALLNKHKLTGVVFRSGRPPFLIGPFPGEGLAGRIRRALDPQVKFPDFRN